jgi:hypothetical protein
MRKRKSENVRGKEKEEEKEKEEYYRKNRKAVACATESNPLFSLLEDFKQSKKLKNQKTDV